jgi:TolA-binding protein
MNCFHAAQSRVERDARRARARQRSRGASVYKPLFFVSLLLFAGLVAVVLAKGQRQKSELERLQVENQELPQLRALKDEFDRLKSESADLERLRKDAEEVVRLRGEVASLRPLVKEQQQLKAQLEQLKATIQQLQQTGAEISALKSQNQQLAGVLAASAQSAACVANLKAMEGAKAQWAALFNKQGNVVPPEADLFGPGKAFQQKPVCPAGGVYHLGPLNARPTCSVAGHSY